MHEPRRQTQNHDIEKAADDEAKRRGERERHARNRNEIEHARVVVRASADDSGEFENRQIHGDHDPANNYTDYDHNERFEQRSQRIDCVADFLLVELGDLEQHGIQRAGFLADRDHLHDHVRKQTGLPHREIQLMSDSDVFADALDRLVIDRTAGGGRYGIKRLDQGNAGFEGDAESAGKTRNSRLVQNLADHGQLEHGARAKMSESGLNACRRKSEWR